jgi:hypothetical protein
MRFGGVDGSGFQIILHCRVIVEAPRAPPNLRL